MNSFLIQVEGYFVTTSQSQEKAAFVDGKRQEAPATDKNGNVLHRVNALWVSADEMTSDAITITYIGAPLPAQMKVNTRLNVTGLRATVYTDGNSKAAVSFKAEAVKVADSKGFNAPAEVK